MHLFRIARFQAFLFASAAIAVGMTPGQASEPRRGDVVLANFEGNGYGDWTTTGTAFGAGPAPGTLPGQMTVAGFRGHGLASSFWHGDAAVGTLTSPEFRITRHRINFLIGGGGFAGMTCMNLVVEGKVVRSATGPNTQPGGSERLEADSWDVGDLHNKTARIEIVDRTTVGWGHISLTAYPLRSAWTSASR